MISFLRWLAWAGLVGLVLLPPCLLFAGVLGAEATKTLMLVGTVAWFAPVILTARVERSQS